MHRDMACNNRWGSQPVNCGWGIIHPIFYVSINIKASILKTHRFLLDEKATEEERPDQSRTTPGRHMADGQGTSFIPFHFGR